MYAPQRLNGEPIAMLTEIPDVCPAIADGADRPATNGDGRPTNKVTDLAALSDQDARLEIIGGYLVALDGEILDVVDKPEPEFHVTSQATAEWVLEKMAAHDGEIAGLSLRLAALQHNLQRMIGEEQRRRDFLEYRYGTELSGFARKNLKGKVKTWRCAFGSISFKKVNPAVVVTDEAAAIAWAKHNCPPAVKIVESILISLVKQNILAEKPSPQHGFSITSAGESITIKTGVLGRKGEDRED